MKSSVRPLREPADRKTCSANGKSCFILNNNTPFLSKRDVSNLNLMMGSERVECMTNDILLYIIRRHPPILKFVKKKEGH